MKTSVYWICCAMILGACGAPADGPGNHGAAAKGDTDDVSKPTITKNVQHCIDRDAAFPDALGDTSSEWLTRCVKWIPVSGAVLSAVHDMAERTDENESDYDAWTTQLYVFKPRFSNVDSFSMYDVERLADDLGVCPDHLINFSFSFRKDAANFDFEALKWTGITHVEEYSETIDDYLHSLLDGEKIVVVQFGEDVTFQGNHQYTLIFTESYIVYMRHYRYDA